MPTLKPATLDRIDIDAMYFDQLCKDRAKLIEALRETRTVMREYVNGADDESPLRAQYLVIRAFLRSLGEE